MLLRFNFYILIKTYLIYKSDSKMLPILPNRFILSAEWFVLKIGGQSKNASSTVPFFEETAHESVLFFTSLIRYKGDKYTWLSCTMYARARYTLYVHRLSPHAVLSEGGHPPTEGDDVGERARISSTRAHNRWPHTFFIYNFALIYAAVRRKSESRRKVRQKGSTWLSVKRDTD